MEAAFKVKILRGLRSKQKLTQHQKETVLWLLGANMLDNDWQRKYSKKAGEGIPSNLRWFLLHDLERLIEDREETAADFPDDSDAS